MRFDLESNYVTESYKTGNFKTDYFIKNWKTNTTIFGSKNTLYSKTNDITTSWDYYNYHGYTNYLDKNFINFNRLYDNIVSEQNAIYRGKEIKTDEEEAHIKIGNNYTIKDINQLKEIVFDNFDENKEKLTIITINNDGDIDFPRVSADKIGLIETNDYFGKKEATQDYEINRELNDNYYGNIIWNIPNAKYIKLAENAPFFGHIIAPNADVETSETQLAGAIIANSFYAEGSSEAHFYPITVKLDCDCKEYHALNSEMKMRFQEYRLNKELGGDATTIKTNVIGNTTQYRKDIATLEHTLSKCPSYHGRKITKNPVTLRPLEIIVLLLVVLSSVGLYTYKKNKKDNSI